MWELEEDGRGRRAVIRGMSNGNKTYKLGGFVKCSEIVGMIASFRRGETDKTHMAELLLFVRDDDELLATNRFKWFPVDELCEMTEAPVVLHALGSTNTRGEHTVPLIRPVTEFKTASELAEHVTSLFSKTPRKRRSPVKQLKLEPFSFDQDSSDDSDPDHEDEQVPSRKRNARSRNRTLNNPSSTKGSPTKNAPLADLLVTPKKSMKKEEVFGYNADSSDDSDYEELQTPANDDQISSDPIDQAKIDQVSIDPSIDPSIDSTSIDLIDDDANQKHPGGESYTVDSSGGHNGSVSSRGSIKTIPFAPPLDSPPTLIDRAMAALHPASEPLTHPCRDDQFDRLFIALESAIAAETGTCVYVSGTPGTGKTSTIREVIGQLDLRVRENELRPFTFVEINGMKLVHPNAAYEHLWSVLDRGSMAASNAMTALEAAFTTNEPIDKRGVIVVLLDELDQLITKGQQLMYNFFNWPSLPHSRLVVIAIANTMDLPERFLSNKISSRLGLTRIQFPGYNYDQLKDIVQQRLEPEFLSLIDSDAVDYATRKVAGVGGDARRVLNFISQAIEQCPHLPDGVVRTSHMRDIIVKSQESPFATFLKTLGVATKVLLCAILARIRRTNSIEINLHDALKQASQFVKASTISQILSIHLYPGNSGRLATFRHALGELVESGLLVQQAIRGEATQNIRLMMPVNSIKEHLEDDSLLSGMI